VGLKSKGIEIRTLIYSVKRTKRQEAAWFGNISMDPLLISVNDTLQTLDMRWPVVFVRDAWNYFDDRPVSHLHRENFASISSTTFSLSSTVHFVGQSFAGDGSYLGRAMFSCYKTSTQALPSTAKIYAKLYSHSGTYGVSSIPNAELKTSTNYYTLGDIYAWNTTPGTVPLVFYFDGTQQLAIGTNYVIGLYSNEITTNSLAFHNSGSAIFGSDVTGNGSTVSSTGTKTASGSDLIHSVCSGVGRFNNAGSFLDQYITYASSAVYFSPDGLNLYLGSTSQRLVQYKLSTPWDVSSRSFWAYGPYLGSYVRQIFFSPDGENMYLVQDPFLLYHYKLTTPFDVSGQYMIINSKDLRWAAGYGDANLKAAISNNGDKLYLLSQEGSLGAIRQFNLSPNWDISSVGAGGSKTQVANSGSVSASSDLYGGSGTNEALAQSFSTITNVNLTSVEVYLTEPYLGVTDGIYAELAETIDGPAIATSRTNYPGVKQQAYAQMIALPFDQKQTIIAGNTYFLRFYRTGARDSGRYPGFYRSTASVSGFGSGKAYVKSSGVWSEISGTTDFSLMLTQGETYGDAGRIIPGYNLLLSSKTRSGLRNRFFYSSMHFSPDGRKLVMISHYGAAYPPYSTHDALQLVHFTLSSPWDITSIQSDAQVAMLSFNGTVPVNSISTMAGMYMSPDGSLIAYGHSGANSNALFTIINIDKLSLTKNDAVSLNDGGFSIQASTGDVLVVDSVSPPEEWFGYTFVEYISIQDIVTAIGDISANVEIKDVVIFDSTSVAEAFAVDSGSRPQSLRVYRTSGAAVKTRPTQAGTIKQYNTLKTASMSNGIKTQTSGTL